jgi:hypothetical protein
MDTHDSLFLATWHGWSTDTGIFDDRTSKTLPEQRRLLSDCAHCGHAGDDLNPFDTVIPVSRLVLTDTGYTLSGHPLQNGHSIELRTSAVDTPAGWLLGRFSWSGNPRARPMILSATCGIAISEFDEVRWSNVPCDESRPAGAGSAGPFRLVNRLAPRTGE